MTEEQRVKLEQLISKFERMIQLAHDGFSLPTKHSKEYARNKAYDRITKHLDFIQWEAALYNLRRAGKPFDISVSMGEEESEMKKPSRFGSRMKKAIANIGDFDHRYVHKRKHMVLRSDSSTTSIQQVEYSLGQGEHWNSFVPVFSDPTDEELSKFYDTMKKLIQECEEENDED
jgi:hypothetical protein